MIKEQKIIVNQDNETVTEELFLSPDNYSLPRFMFEAYFTDEESFEPYVPLSSYTPEDEDGEKKKKTRILKMRRKPPKRKRILMVLNFIKVKY